MDPPFSSHHRRERFFRFLLAVFLQIIHPADDPDAAGAPPEVEAVVVVIDHQPPSKITKYKRRSLEEEDRVLPPPSPSALPPSELHQPRTPQQRGGNRVDDCDEEASRRQVRKRPPRLVKIPSLERRKSLKDNKKLKSRHKAIERAMKGPSITVSVSASAMVAIFTHPEYMQIVLLKVSSVLFLGSLVTGLIIPLLNVLSCINVPLWLFRSMEWATYSFLFLGMLAVCTHFMGMYVFFTLALLLVVPMIAYFIDLVVGEFRVGA